MQTCTYRLLAALLAVLLLRSAAGQLQFSEGWAHGKRDVSARLAAAGRPSLLDVLTSGTLQRADTCRPDVEALGLIYDLVMREVEKVIACRTREGLLKPSIAR